MTLFALPLVGGAGLGNGLFPWARAELFARSAKAPVLAPRWTRFRIGPYLRREPEKRRYGGFFRAAGHVRGISRLVIRARARHLPEGQPPQVYAEAQRSSLPSVVRFEGTADLFTPLLGEHDFIRDKLWDMTREPLRAAAMAYPVPFVALHVRRGDITRQGFSANDLSDVKQYTPLSWFKSMVSEVKQIASVRNLSIVVFTDGSAEELQELLVLEGVRLHDRRTAITDLWIMSQASLLFASGFSTFGMWASYLGGMPTLYAPGKLQQRVQAGRPGPVELEIGEGEAIPDAALLRVPGVRLS